MDKANKLLPDGVLFFYKTLTRDVDLYSLYSMEERNRYGEQYAISRHDLCVYPDNLLTS